MTLSLLFIAEKFDDSDNNLFAKNDEKHAKFFQSKYYLTIDQTFYDLVIVISIYFFAFFVQLSLRGKGSKEFKCGQL